MGQAEQRFLPICLFPVSLRSTFFISQIAPAVVLNSVWNSLLLKQIPNRIVHMLPTQTVFIFSPPDNEILYLRPVGRGLSKTFVDSTATAVRSGLLCKKVSSIL